MRKRILLVYFLLMAVLPLSAANDSTIVFSLSDFLVQVIKYHPVAKQAELLSEQGRQQLRVSRGLFDPQFKVVYDNKTYDDKMYWDKTLASFSVPLWIGELKTSYQNNGGQYLNPENNTPQEGLNMLGVSVPLGQGLIIDERRAQLRSAQLMQQMAEADRVKMINDLLLRCTRDYWDWMFYYQKMRLNREAYLLALHRFENVIDRVNAGDLASIDTIEAGMQVSNFRVAVAQSELEYRNASLVLSNHLWAENETPVQVNDNFLPSEEGSEVRTLSPQALDSLILQAQQQHPDLRKAEIKVGLADIDRRLYGQKLIPKVNTEFYILSSGLLPDPGRWSGSYIGSNAKVGLSFSYPLFIREERGKYKLSQLKLSQVKYEQLQLNREIENRIRMQGNEWASLENQIKQQETVVSATVTMREGEMERFRNGESSIFLINIREQTMVQQQIRLYELRTRYAKNIYLMKWAAGNML